MMRPKHKLHATADPASGRAATADPARPGILTPRRQAGQRQAVERAADYQGFTKAVPSVDRACMVLRDAARRGPLGQAVSHTLEILLQLQPRRGWAGRPMLRVTNGTLASHVGCSERQVQRHLAVLHEHGVIGIQWGRGHARLSFDVDAAGRKAEGPVGIDLRPALVFVHEQAGLVRAIHAAQQDFLDVQAQAQEAVWQAKVALIHATERLGPEQYDAMLQRIEQLRGEIGRLSRAALGGKALPDGIAAAIRAMEQLTFRAHGLRSECEEGDTGGDETEDNHQESSPSGDIRPSHITDSNYVESVVPTIQANCPEAGLQPARAAGMDEAHRRPGSAWPAAQAGADEEADPAAPLLYRRWLDAYDGSRPLPSDELAELEITARLQARNMGVAARVIEAAAQRHGMALTIGAILFVATLPGRTRVRSPAALLASLLQRQPGTLAPESFARRPHTEPPLDAAEALGIAKRLAPGHQPHWVLGRWHATRQRRGEPITAPRSCLAAFARKLQREHAGYAG
ncbi:MAG: helix-turn-helix domain-containing protein [Geminicoccaceae bacterium]